MAAKGKFGIKFGFPTIVPSPSGAKDRELSLTMNGGEPEKDVYSAQDTVSKEYAFDVGDEVVATIADKDPGGNTLGMSPPLTLKVTDPDADKDKDKDKPEEAPPPVVVGAVTVNSKRKLSEEEAKAADEKKKADAEKKKAEDDKKKKAEADEKKAEHRQPEHKQAEHRQAEHKRT